MDTVARLQAFRSVGIAAILLGSLLCGQAGGGTLGSPSITPGSITAGTPAEVTFSVSTTGRQPNPVMGEIQGTKFVCSGNTYQYQVPVFSPGATVIWGGQASDSGTLPVPPGALDGTLFSITARIKSCSKSMAATASDGTPGDISESGTCASHPFDCLIIRELGDEAEAWVVKYSAALGDGLGGGCADAARHAYVNALGALAIGAAATKNFLDAHEYSNNNGCEDNNMDLSNNASGRGLGQSCGPSRACVQRAVANALKSGDLTVWSGNRTGIGSLVSSSICTITY